MSEQNIGSLEKISEVFNTTFEMSEVEEVKKIDQEIEKFSSIKNSVINPTQLILEDQLELRDGLKRIIDMTSVVMSKLNDDIKIGSKVSSHMAVSMLTKSIVEAYRELRELNQYIFEAKLKLNPDGAIEGMTKTDKIELTADQLTEMLESARKNSSMNAIEVDFKVEE